MRTGVVIVSYNSAEEIRRLLPSLRTALSPDDKVFIVDNSSSASTLRQELQAESNIEYLVLTQNLGFAAGCNEGIRAALAQDAQYVWLLNPDTTVDALALSAMVTVLQSRQEAGAVGSKVLWGNENRIWSLGGNISRATGEVSMIRHGEADSGDFLEPLAVDYIPGCSILIRRAALMNPGLLREEYFLYFEETDWCVRARRAGWKLLIEPKSIVAHHFQGEKMQEPLRVYYYNRNRRIFWSRFGTVRVRMETFLTTFFRSLPESRRALRGVQTAAEREIFLAHERSCIDFLLHRFGCRW